MKIISNEVLAEQITNLKDIVMDFKRSFDEHLDDDGKRLGAVEKWVERVTGALVVMNIIFVPIALWVIFKLLERKM